MPPDVSRSEKELARNILAGSIAVSTAVGLMNPLDTLRVRWQVLIDPSHGTTLRSFAHQIVRDEGKHVFNSQYNPTRHYCPFATDEAMIMQAYGMVCTATLSQRTCSQWAYLVA